MSTRGQRPGVAGELRSKERFGAMRRAEGRRSRRVVAVRGVCEGVDAQGAEQREQRCAGAADASAVASADGGACRRRNRRTTSAARRGPATGCAGCPAGRRRARSRSPAPREARRSRRRRARCLQAGSRAGLGASTGWLFLVESRGRTSRTWQWALWCAGFRRSEEGAALSRRRRVVRAYGTEESGAARSVSVARCAYVGRVPCCRAVGGGLCATVVCRSAARLPEAAHHILRHDAAPSAA